MHPAMHQGNSIQETQSETPSLADFVHLQLGTIGFCLMESRYRIITHIHIGHPTGFLFKLKLSG